MTEQKPLETTTSPDSLLDDQDSLAFFILRNESVVLCKVESEVSYNSDRSTYLSTGRFSPKYKTIVFWPDPINPKRAVDLLVENGHVDTGYTWQVSGAAMTSNVSHKPKKIKANLNGVRKSEVDNLLKRGLKVQDGKTT